ncbi:MAG: hypothetical protein AB9872_09805 [Solidesulfovibrio sp.]
MQCLEHAIATVRASLSWSVEDMASEADAPEGWSNPETRTHVLVTAKSTATRLDVLAELVHASLCETMPRLFSTTKVWGVSLPGHAVARKHYLRATRNWFVAARMRELCQAPFDEALGTALEAARPRIITTRPFHLDPYNLSQDERQRLTDGRLLAAARLWIDRNTGPNPDPVVGDAAAAYASVDPASPDMPGFLAVANGLCAATGRRPFAPEPRKGYWIVRDSA